MLVLSGKITRLWWEFQKIAQYILIKAASCFNWWQDTAVVAWGLQKWAFDRKAIIQYDLHSLISSVYVQLSRTHL